MNSSVIIAQLIGPLMLLMGVSFFINFAGLKEVGREFIESRSLIMLAGVVVFIPGLAIVNFHNIWIMEWPVVITLFGWLMVAAGIMRIAFFDQLQVLGRAMLLKDGLLRTAALFMMALGAFLSFKGYF